jgi:hypothetical protein
VLGTLRLVVEEPVRALEPPAGERDLPAELPEVGGEPGSDPARGDVVPALAVGAVGPLPGVEDQVRVGQPPGGPAQALEGLGRLRPRERALETLARRAPVPRGQLVIAGAQEFIVDPIGHLHPPRASVPPPGVTRQGRLPPGAAGTRRA